MATASKPKAARRRASARGAATEAETTSPSERTRVTGTSESMRATVRRRPAAVSAGVASEASRTYMTGRSRSGVMGRYTWSAAPF